MAVQTLHLKTSEQVMTKVMDFLNRLSKQGADIEIIDNKVYEYEKNLIDQSLRDIEEGRTYSIEEVEKRLSL